jgi:signal transduction histidine kinase
VDDASAGPIVEADPDRLMQVVSNLLDNALRVTPASGAVTPSIGEFGETGSLTVSDTGPGIAAEDLPHAFERFYLRERSTEESRDGSGLGLAIVAELTQAMGGTASVWSALGEGARFTLALPARSTAHVLH